MEKQTLTYEEKRRLGILNRLSAFGKISEEEEAERIILSRLSERKFYWQPRYSDTDQPDKQGRWSRLCYCNEILIAWINRIEYGGQIVFSVTDYFPSSGNSNPCYSGIYDNLEAAKEGVESRFEEVMIKFNF